jgi:hypothetical protein
MVVTGREGGPVNFLFKLPLTYGRTSYHTIQCFSKLEMRLYYSNEQLYCNSWIRPHYR